MPNYVKLVEVTIKALRMLSDNMEGLGVREISRMLDLNKSTTHRLLLTLQKEGLVEYNETTRKYVMSIGVLQITNKTLQNNNLINVALPYMNELRDITNETIALHIPVLNNRMVIAKAESHHELRWSPIIGKFYPLYLGAASKVIAAFLPTALFDELLVDLPQEMSKDYFKKEIEQIRFDKITTSHGEVEQGGNGTAVPILDKAGNLQAALSIYALQSRVSDEKLLMFREELINTSQQIIASLDIQ